MTGPQADLESAGTFAIGRWRVNRIGYGAMQLAGDNVFGPPRDRDEALQVLRTGIKSGINHIDTAQYFGPGVVNELIRESLYPYPRDLAIVSKVAARRDEAGAVLAYDEPDQLRAGIEENLTTLQAGHLAAVNLRVMDGSKPGKRFDAQIAALIAAQAAHPAIAPRSKLHSRAVAELEPLSSTEEMFWRALMRILLTLPRVLHDDMIRGAGLSASEYTVIMNLSEAPNRQLRMSDLATATGLSASRTTRLVDGLQSHGLVAKRASSADGRSNLAELTSSGLTKLRSAWPAHLASARRRVLDHIPPGTLTKAAQALEAVCEQLEGDRAGAP